MRRSLLCSVVLMASALAAHAADWRLDRAPDGMVSLAVASSTSPAELTFTCEPGRGTFDWALTNLPEGPNAGAGAIAFGTGVLRAGMLDPPVRFPYVTFQRRLISPANDRSLPDRFLVRFRAGGANAITFADGANIISLPGPALDAQALLRHARAAVATGTDLRIGSDTFDVTGVDAAMTRLIDACVGPRD